MKPGAGIRGWPEAERPRERLAARGPQALSNAELLAILLRTGRRGKSAVDLGREMLARAGSLKRLAERLPRELISEGGVGLAKASAVAAAFELGRRMLSEPDGERPRFSSSADVWRHFRPLRVGRKREVFEIAMLDTAHRLIKAKTITVGTLNLALVHPRDVFREAIAESAAGIVVLHNHPSGDPTPSPEDVKLTRQLVQAGEAVGIAVLDHIILGAERYFSFADTRKLAG